MRKFYSEVWRLAIHFRDPKELIEFKNPVGDYGYAVKVIHETDDFILLETEELKNFTDLVDDVVRGCTPTFLTIKQVLK